MCVVFKTGDGSTCVCAKDAYSRKKERGMKKREINYEKSGLSGRGGGDVARRLR